MLTATIEQKVFSLHQTSSILVLHIHNNSESLLDHFVKDLTECLQQKSQLQDRSFCFSNSNKQHQNHNRLNNKHLDGGLKSHFFFFSPKKQTHTPK